MYLKEPQKQQANKSSKTMNRTLSLSKGTDSWWQPAMEVCAKVTGLIAGPIVIALFLGQWLDSRYHTEPWFFLASMGLAFIASLVGIVKIALKYIKDIEKEAKEKKDFTDSSQINYRWIMDI